jgi:hypothetical protein
MRYLLNKSEVKLMVHTNRVSRRERGVAVRMNTKAVSEVVGYIFVFGIIMTAVTFAYLNITNLVQDTSEKYRVEGLRESFRRIQNVFFLSTYGGAPLQSIQIEFQGGVLYIANNTRVRILFNDTPVVDEYVGTLNYKYKDYVVTVENVAVWEDYYGNKRTIMNPRIFVQRVQTQGPSGATQTIVMVVVSILKGNLSMSGEGSVNLIFNSSVREVIFNTTPGILRMEVTSDYAKNWCEFFHDLTSDVSPTTCTPAISQTEMRVYYDRAIVTVYETRVETRQV